MHDPPGDIGCGRGGVQRPVGLLDQPLDGFAGFAARALIHKLEDSLEAFYLAFGLIVMFFEGLLKLRGGRALGHFGKSFQDLLLPVIDILEVGKEQFLECAS